ncbi:MAG: trypsin-like peptidase domain-containing protein [Phycisphaeraceae bacterium]
MSQLRWYGPSLILIIAAMAVMIFGPTTARQIVHAQESERIILARESLESSSVLMELSEAFTRVSEAVEPSVVKIVVLARQQSSTLNRPGNPDLRDWFFNRPGQSPPDPREDEEEDLNRFNAPTVIGSGSGWVYDTEGHIITNNHVVESADQVRVEFANGDTIEAEIVGTDPRTDIAVLKVDADYLHPAAINTQPVRQGEMVFAFGSPLGFDFSMSQGIVSATGRQLGILRRGRNSGYEDFIQTDAAINRGNSGGPLTNVHGEVVGMNTAIASRTGGSNGVGFAIPSEMILDIVTKLISDGRVSRGFIGVRIRDITEPMARAYGLDSTSGAFVEDPLPGSPAEVAGLEPEDIITEINGSPIDNADDLRFRIARMGPGTDVDLGVWRDGTTLTITVTLTEFPEQTIRTASRPERELEEMPEARELLFRLGIQGIARFTAEDAQRMGVDTGAGILVTFVRGGSVAAAQGITRGTVILEAQGQPVTRLDELSPLIEGLGAGDVIRLRVTDPRQSGDPTFVFLEIPGE